MPNKRRLNFKEVTKIIGTKGWVSYQRFGDMLLELLDAQDAKTRRETLKETGKYLDTHTHLFGSKNSQLDCFTDPNWTKLTSDLLRGEMPK